LPRYKFAVFVHGCFWHQHQGCKKARLPSQNAEFWRSKLELNRKRDESNKAQLERLGWKVFVIWECALRYKTEELLAMLEQEQGA
jgi:DNA mismatch endonuclease (patch repair protein)